MQIASFVPLDSFLHACNNLIVVRYDVSQCFNIFYRDNSSHPLRHIPCKLDLMIIHMLIELMLTRHKGRYDAEKNAVIISLKNGE